MNRLWQSAMAATVVVFVSAQACAQPKPGQLDIIGLTLGMTVDQAKDVLGKYDPKLRAVTLYSLDVAQLGKWAPSDNVFASAHQKVPIAIHAALITQALDLNGKDITDESDDKLIYSLSGEWYDLEFTPSDEGGRLYAVERVVKYPTVGGPVDELRQKLLAKYGKPSVIDPSGSDAVFYHLYDVRGRFLTERSRDTGRCLTRDLVAPHGNAYSFSYKGLPWKVYHADYEGGKIDLFTQPFADDTGQNPDPQYRQCGVELANYIHSVDELGKHVTYFTTRLTDQNAVNFDNGIQAYWTRKLPPVKLSAPPKL